jgi:hypothetical protein
MQPGEVRLSLRITTSRNRAIRHQRTVRTCRG